MGEYARITTGPSAGQEVKIGTCEEMYYVRHDQRHAVAYQFDAGDRFRFPFPDEDELEPGAFDNHDRGWPIPEWRIPDEWADGHGSVQFTSTAGYVLSIPCPESVRNSDAGTARINGITVHRNGFNGGPRIVQQREHEEQLVTIVQCGACGHKWRLSLELAEEVAVCLRTEADRTFYRAGELELYHGESGRRTYHAIADRMLAGYLDGYPAIPTH